MPGVTKRIFEHDVRDIISMWNDEIKTLMPLLPQEYTKKDIINLLRKYYPYEWISVESKYTYYHTKDKYIMKFCGKARFKMLKPELLICKVPMYKKISSEYYLEYHKNNFSEDKCEESKTKLWNQRQPKIEHINKKIEKALYKTQQVTPTFIDQLIGLYERKNTSQKDRVYILLELKKYYCKKVIQFFFKLNDTELNKQLRFEAFYYLQEFNFNPRLRKQKYMLVHTNNKVRKNYLKNVYSNEKYIIKLNPNELEYRIENSKEQKIKSYDYFISHSSKDSKEVQELIRKENNLKKNIFCDWINDIDYLKRHLLCNATLRVLEERMKQSKALIFVQSENSLSSVWCKYELNFFFELHKPFFIIEKDSIINKDFELKAMNDYWFIDSDYKESTLIFASKIYN